MSQMQLFLLGPPRVESGEKTINVGTRKNLALLIYLAVTHRTHRRDSLVTLLWPDSREGHGRSLLRGSLHALRKAMSADLLDADRETVRLSARVDLWVDADRFRELIDQSGVHKHENGTPNGTPYGSPCPDCQEMLMEAVDLYKGAFLTGFSLRNNADFDTWEASQSQGHLSAMDLACERLITILGARRDWDQAIAYALRWLELDRLNEGAHRLLMELYARSGQRTAAIAQYRECRMILGTELDALPVEATVRLYNDINENRIQSEEIPVSITGETTNLPRYLTSFVGRERETTDLRQLLMDVRLLTLVGPGGCGKSRLAMHVADSSMAQFNNWVWFVDMAPLSDPTDVTLAAASTFGILDLPEQDARYALAAYLGKHRSLLIFDNCEHLSESCASLVDELLHRCGDLTVMVTSREPLNIPSEVVWRVPSLSFPDFQDTQSRATKELIQYDALKLFLARAEASSPGFSASKSMMTSVARIARRLDGIPLALELAAAKIKVLSIEQIEARLDEHFDLLDGGSRVTLPRHQTLGATMEWSYGLLSQEEQILFRRLSVFSDGWTVAAAECVCADEIPEISSADVLGLLTQLVNKSMVQHEDRNGDGRYWFLQTIWRFAAAKLALTGEALLIRGNHASFYLTLTEAAEWAPDKGNRYALAGSLPMEKENLLAAFRYFRNRSDIAAASRLAGAVLRSFSKLSISFSHDNQVRHAPME